LVDSSIWLPAEPKAAWGFRNLVWHGVADHLQTTL
jgi:hypothetical protein